MHKIIVFGCRAITVDIIKYLIDNNYEIQLVVHHDEDRDRIYGSMLVSEYCNVNNINNIRFDKDIDAELIKSLQPSIIISSYYRKILKADILNIPIMGCVNVHPAALPVGRGPAPTMWNVINGDKYAGATLHYMVEGVDAGDIVDQRIIRVDDRTGFELNRDLMYVCYDLITSNIKSLCNGTNKRITQNHDNAEYCLPFKKTLRYLTWDNPDKILNSIRAFTKPYDGAIAHTAKNERVVVWSATKLLKRNSFSPPGYFEKTPDGIIVQTNTSPIIITDYDIISSELRNTGRFISGAP
jgi:methionyl-tRNA formyltransferase